MIREIIRLASSPGGGSLLAAILRLIKSFKEKGYGNEEIRIRIDNIRSKVKESDDKDRNMFDRYYPTT